MVCYIDDPFATNEIFPVPNPPGDHWTWLWWILLRKHGWEAATRHAANRQGEPGGCRVP